MSDASSLANMFNRNLRVIEMQTDGLTQEDSLLQLPFRGNCLNWILGHIAGSRQNVIESLGGEAIMGKESRERYDRGSEPIAGDEKGILKLEELLDLLKNSGDVIADLLENISQEDWEALTGDEPRQQKLSDWVTFLAWHDSYHTGQTEIMRQLAGKDDQVIK